VFWGGRRAEEAFVIQNVEEFMSMSRLFMKKNFLQVPEVMGREEKGWEKILLDNCHSFAISFLSLKLSGRSCVVKVKSLGVRGATRGRSEDLRGARGRGRSDKELKR